MNKINQIEQIINSTINHYSHVKLFPRGIQRFVDPSLRGQIRFGKKTGSTVGLINPDNTFKLNTIPLRLDNKIDITRTSEWIVPDSIIKVGDKDTYTVDDITDILGIGRITTVEAINAEFTLEDKVILYAFPMMTYLEYSHGDTEIWVKTKYPLANGDVFSYKQTDGLLQSLQEVKIVEAIRRTEPDEFDTYYTIVYRLVLEKPIARDFQENTLVYMRAYPAYFSQIINVPNSIFTNEPVGPFVLDTMSGNVLEGKDSEEHLSYRTLNRTGGYLLGTKNKYVTVDKNYLVMKRPIAAHVPGFWELAEGTVRFSPNRIHFRTDPLKNVFCIGLKCIPFLPYNFTVTETEEVQPLRWILNLVATNDCTIRFIFYPNDPIEFTLMGGVARDITVEIPQGNDITDIEINIASDFTCEVKMSDWTHLDGTVEQMEYSLVAYATGISTWQSSGLMVKPMFFGSEYLKLVYDSGYEYDGGKVNF